MIRLPKQFRKYFWDTDFEKIIIQKHRNYIILRLAEYGDDGAHRWLTKNFSKEIIKKIVTKSRQASAKTKNFWQFIS